MVFGVQRFELIQKFQSGVYDVETVLVQDVFFNTKYVVKGCPKISKYTQKLLDEGELTMACQSPYVVRYIDNMHSKTHQMIGLEYCNKGDLFEYFSKTGSLSVDNIIRIIKNILWAVRDIHARGVVHNDLKLENIFIDKDDILKVGDFGLSFRESKPPAKWCGTAAYIPPEYLSGPYTQKIDIWSIGILAYMLSTGTAPFGQYDMIKIIRRHRFVPEQSGINNKIWSLIESCLKVSPTDRPTAEQLLSQLE